MANNSKRYELDLKIENLIKNTYDGFKIYLPTPQDKAMYDRKVKEFWDTIHAGIKELNDGRTDNDTATAGN